jgi:hypothetical protein
VDGQSAQSLLVKINNPYPPTLAGTSSLHHFDGIHILHGAAKIQNPE